MQALAKQLVGMQNADGGWSQEKDKESDALGTGQALYALSAAGLSDREPFVARAWTFLVKTQKPDGSWYVPTRVAVGGSRFSSYMGSAWASMGMVRTLPSKKGP